MSLTAMVWALNEAPWESATEALVLITLADYAGYDESPWIGACPSHQTIAEAARVSTRTVRRCLNNLEDRGVIVRGDQSITERFRPDRRPVVWNLNGQMKRTTTGHSHDRPVGLSGRPKNDERGDTAMSYDPSNNPIHGASDDAPKRNDYPEDFQTFWSHYPSRGKHPNPKKAAYGKWKTAIKTTDPQLLINAVKAYASSSLPDDRQMIPQAATWLSQERWEEQDTTSDIEWLRECWQTGNIAAVTRRTGFNYSGVVWPDPIPDNPEELALIRLRQAREWIDTNRDRILERLTNAA